MSTALWLLVGVLVFAALGLFVGGIVSAALEIRAEKRAGVPVLRPGWRKSDRPVVEKRDFKVPAGTAWVVWPLVAVGLPHVAERYLVRRFGGRRESR